MIRDRALNDRSSHRCLAIIHLKSGNINMIYGAKNASVGHSCVARVWLDLTGKNTTKISSRVLHCFNI